MRNGPPAPGRGPLQRSEPQRQAGRANQPPDPDPRGTDYAPLTVKIQPPAKTDAETAKEQNQEQQQATAQQWTIGLGMLTGLVGLLQLGAIVGQVLIARKQNTNPAASAASTLPASCSLIVVINAVF